MIEAAFALPLPRFELRVSLKLGGGVTATIDFWPMPRSNSTAMA